MKKKTQGRGAPVTIGEPTAVATYNLTVKQKGWIKAMAAREELPSASDFMREIITEAMIKRGIDPKDPPQDFD
jgi:hypothetical protein